MPNPLPYIRNLVGNGKAATIGIFAFILLLAFMFYQAAYGAEVDIAAGASFGSQGSGAVLGLNVKQPVTANPGLSLFAGTDLWGNTIHNNAVVPNNWDWHAGIESCKGKFCASIGPAFVQRVDAINGAHTNFYLGLAYHFTPRLSLVLGHISDAGTSDPNVGRQALSISYKLQ